MNTDDPLRTAASMPWDERWLYEQLMADDAHEREYAMQQRREDAEANAENPNGAGHGGGAGYGAVGGGAPSSKACERIEQGINPAVARHANVAAPRND